MMCLNCSKEEETRIDNDPYCWDCGEGHCKSMKEYIKKQEIEK